MGMFIRVDVDKTVTGQPELARKLAEVCPVDIFAVDPLTKGATIVEDNVDECVLCDLCVQAAPAGSISIVKLYQEA